MPTPYTKYHQNYHNIFVGVSGRGTGKISPNTGTPAMVKMHQCVSDREMDAILDEEFNAQHSKNAYDPLPVPFSAKPFEGFPSSLALPQSAPVAAAHGQYHDERSFYFNTMTASPINAYPKFPNYRDTSAESKKKNSGRKIDALSRDQDVFSERLEMLREFKNIHGHTNVSSNNGTYGLYRWCLNVKRGYQQWKAGERNRHGINDAQVKQLEALGFNWETKNPLVFQDGFEEKLKELREFREKHGHTNVPTKHPLSWWCYRMKASYKLWMKGEIDAQGFTDEKVKRLEELGFEWNLRRTKKEYMERKFQELLEFKQTHGHLNVPHGEKKTLSLYKWCNAVRLEYRQWTLKKVPLPGPFGLTEELVHRLREIGFRFSITVRKSFKKRLEDLREHKSKYGHLNTEKDKSLAEWCTKIRRAYARWALNLPGENCGLNEERVKKLEEVGFVFYPPRTGPRA